jgi:hypothetical protein
MGVAMILIGAWFLFMGWFAFSTPNRRSDATLGSSSWMGNPTGRRVGGFATVLWGIILILFGIRTFAAQRFNW